MTGARGSSIRGILLVLPSMLWLLVFAIVPVAYHQRHVGDYLCRDLLAQSFDALSTLRLRVTQNAH